MSDETKVDYEELERIAMRFSARSQVVQEISQRMRNGMESFRNQWSGRGADAFFSEMESEVLPATMRLQEALSTASDVTHSIIQIMQQAEKDASQPFSDAD